MKGMVANMNIRLFKRVLSLLLCLAVAVSLLSCGEKSQKNIDSQQELVKPDSVAAEPITVIACSDFQNYGGASEAAKTFGELLDAVKISHSDIQGFIFAGDYHTDIAQYVGTASSQEGIDTLREALYSRYKKGFFEVYAEGNHDIKDVDGISESGANDPKSGDFGVFVINEDDYMWQSDTAWSEANSGSGLTSSQIVRRTADNLNEYLNEKAENGFTKPIFILSHLPIHYSMRTRLDGDGMYADMLFEVINSYGARGLNIIFLFGHDHSNGWDDYLGGSAIYLAKGDSINIARSSKTDFSAETLEFTYMNAGYVGYYDNHNGCDDALTMTVFEILEDSVIVYRYDKDGLHSLKSAGVPNFYKGEKTEYYKPDKRTVSGSQTIELSREIKPPMTEDTKTNEDKVQPYDNNGSVLTRFNGDISSLESGSYLLVYNGSEIMTNQSVERDGSSGKRIGFELIKADFAAGISQEIIDSSIWVLTQDENGGWLIGCGEKSIKLTKTSDKGIIAELAANGDRFTISGGNGRYTFSTDNAVLNYNSRGLINGYANQPAEFELYKLN